jgi:hypothetical protein
MVKTNLLKQQFSPEQNKVFDEILFERENTVLAYKILLKQYAATKSKIRTIEKKLIDPVQEINETDFTLRRIEYEIAAIENKYKAIDKAIKNYKDAMKNFDHIIVNPHGRTFNPNSVMDWYTNGLKNHLRTAHYAIEQGLDAIRITKRYFKNITQVFQSNALRQKYLKSRQLRQQAIIEARPEASGITCL